MLLKLDASRPISSRRLDVDRVVEVLGRRDVRSRCAVSCSIGRTMRRAISHASDAATIVPASAMSSSRVSSDDEHVVVGVDAARDLRPRRWFGSATVSIR